MLQWLFASLTGKYCQTTYTVNKHVQLHGCRLTRTAHVLWLSLHYPSVQLAERVSDQSNIFESWGREQRYWETKLSLHYEFRQELGKFFAILLRKNKFFVKGASLWESAFFCKHWRKRGCWKHTQKKTAIHTVRAHLVGVIMGLMHIYAESDRPRLGMVRDSSNKNWNLVKAELGQVKLLSPSTIVGGNSQVLYTPFIPVPAIKIIIWRACHWWERNLEENFVHATAILLSSLQTQECQWHKKESVSALSSKLGSKNLKLLICSQGE